ncbi:MAG: aminotransferase class I/II-fold pyridoxal phosphate-dependent enzyme [Bradymonadales bacterium]|nr:aminotransferase class I/II-fold pyridoxal phosphate-dependent enzyme [Bradymonadales bacterium]
MVERISDFRSDTVTRPTEAMRRSVLTADLGDDVLGCDPTVERLQRLAAEIIGMEAALFVTSGTMGNLLALCTHCSAGDEVILGESAHIILHEVGGMARIAHAMPRTLPNPKGRLDWRQVEAAIRSEDIHHPRTALICTENTHEASGGSVVPLEDLGKVQEVARRHGLPVHLDGARIFNASVASGVSVRDFAATADSLTFCLSKGLCCPAGSLLCGSRAFIAQARKMRKLLGGGMRQLGFLAAPGIIALETLVDRLAEDHRRARQLAEGIAGMPGVQLDLDGVQTNIVYLRVITMPAQRLQQRLEERGIYSLALEDRLRLVTHRDVDDGDVERAIAAFRVVLGKGKGAG